ncbi:MAG: hypothetical protein R3F33_17340 [Planctomycetota bacterium]
MRLCTSLALPLLAFALNALAAGQTCSGFVDDAFEDNDTCATATALTPGTYPGLGVIFGDDDYFAVTIPAGSVLEWNELADSNDTTYDLWDGGCANLLLVDQFAGFAYANPTASPMPVIVRAYNWLSTGAACSNYDLMVAFGSDPCPGLAPDAFEDNDTCGTAAPVGAGSYAGLNVSVSDPDYYAITIPAGEILTVLETADSNHCECTLWDATCAAPLAGPSDTGFEHINLSGAAQSVVLEVRQSAGAGAACSDYAFDIAFAPDTCQGAGDDGFESNDDCATAAGLTDGTYTGLFVSKASKDHYALCVGPGDTLSLTVLYALAQGDVDAFLWAAGDANCGSGLPFTSELALGYSSTDNEYLNWTNTSLSDVQVVLEVNIWSGSLQHCNTYDLVVQGAGGCGGSGSATPFCDPMDANSTGLPTQMVASYGTGVGSGLHLEALQGPPTQFGYFLVGTGVNDPGLPLGGGRFCLSTTGGNVFGRYNVAGELNSVGQFDAAGVLLNVVGTSTVGSGYDVPATVPITGSPVITSGSTWNFQLWHREAGGASNFSNGLSVTFP